MVNQMTRRRRDGHRDDEGRASMQVVDMLDAAKPSPRTLPFETALITGASRGLGRALARSLALEQGVAVVLVARGAAELDALVHEIRAGGGVAHAIAADVSDKHAVHRIAGGAAALVGDIDLLIHDASTLGPTPLRLLLDGECEDFAAVLETNLIGPYRLSKLVLGSMLVRGRGTLLAISSDAAVEAYAGWGMYGVSKAALDQLVRVWAAELADTPLRLLAVDPGEMDTAMHAAALPDADPSTLARPEQVAAAIVELLRDAAPRSGARVSAAQLLAAREEVVS
jgi:NAD(P)-dependent dehydrogenase (short-subunit alcohol dehydrogenase family)